MENKVVCSRQVPPPIGPYSQAIYCSPFLFTSGQIPLSAETGALAGDTIEEQTRQVLANLKAVLAEAGMTFSDVVKTTVFLTDLKDFPTVNELYAEAFTDTFPARSCIQVSSLPANAKIEIELIARRP